MTNAERLAEIEAREKAATPGPWFQWTTAGDVSSEPLDGMIMRTYLTETDADGITRATPQGDADCEFVCAAREDIPWLCEQLRKAWEALKDAHGCIYSRDCALADDDVQLRVDSAPGGILHNIRAALAAEGSGDE